MRTQRPEGTTVLMGLATLASWLLVGCAGLPPHVERPVSVQRIAADDTPLGRVAGAAGVPAGRSGFRPLTLSGVALQARLALIDQARHSVDLQTYLIGDDATGHQVMRALRDAAGRGVRIRLLVDDLYTDGMTDLLLGLAAHDNVELRLYNPFPTGREWWAGKFWSLLSDFSRLNHRMHNKLFLADGRVAVIGGRNLADEYFMRGGDGNFLDFDLLCAGVVVRELGEHFDAYWNSDHAYPVQALADNGLDAEQRRRSFDVLTRRETGNPARPAQAVPPEARAEALALWRGDVALTVADARVFFDSPDKTAGALRSDNRLPVVSLLAEARKQVILVSPYFVPSETGLQRMQQARAKGVEIEIITNSLVDSDEPLVSLAYGRHRIAMLRAGVRLFELSSALLKQEPRLRTALGAHPGRLHAKLGFVDGKRLLVGSMNMDPRSASTNTEMAIAIDSAELTQRVLDEIRVARQAGTLEVRLAADQQSLEWVGIDPTAAPPRIAAEPQPAWWQRLRWWFLSLFVPDDLL